MKKNVFRCKTNTTLRTFFIFFQNNKFYSTKQRSPMNSAADQFDCLIAEMSMSPLKNYRRQLLNIFLTTATYILKDWLYKHKITILLTLYDFSDPALCIYVLNFFVSRNGSNLRYLVNFVRKTPSLKKVVVMMGFDPVFKEKKWSGEAYMRNPMVLYDDLKKEALPNLVNYAKRLVAQDARYSLFFRVFSDSELVFFPRYDTLINMVRFEANVQDRICLELTIRHFSNRLRKNTYLGSRWFDDVGNTIVSPEGYVALIAQFVVGPFSFKGMEDACVVDRNYWMKRMPDHGRAYFKEYPKEPFILKRKTHVPKQSASKKPRVSN